MKKFLIIIIGILLGSSAVKAQEENIIALSIYNFTRYIDWPKDEASNDFFIDVIGHKSVFDKLKEMTTGRKVGNRNIVVRYLESINGISTSQILFVGFWQSKDLAKIAEKTSGAHTLIISEKDGMIDSGSAINFVIRNSTIKFEIKKANIVKHGLIVSDGLEQIAYKTYQ